MVSLLSCPDCNGKVSRRAEACPHCGCPMAYILEAIPAEEECKSIQASRKIIKEDHVVSRSEFWETQRGPDLSKISKAKSSKEDDKKKSEQLRETMRRKKYQRLLGVAVSYDSFGSGIVIDIDQQQITIRFISDRQECSFSLEDFSKYGRFMMIQDADAFNAQFHNRTKWHNNSNSCYTSTSDDSYMHSFDEEIDEQLDENYYIGDGDDWG